MRILIVRACAVGDFVLHLPALRAMAAAHPQAQFTLVGYPATLALARTFIPVEGIVSIESPPWSSLFTEPVEGLEFDAARVWMRDSSFANNLRLSGISDVLRLDPFPTLPQHGAPNVVHAAAHLLDTVQYPAPELPDLWAPGSTQVLLHPGSGGRHKIWPGFADLARALPEAHILIGPSDTALPVPNPRIEGLSLTDVAEKLQRYRVVVGNDSGITHLAAYLGTPTVALFGPTDPNIWGPIGRRVTLLHRPALAEIAVEEVLRCLQEQIHPPNGGTTIR